MIWAVLVLVLSVVVGLAVIAVFAWRLFKQGKSLAAKVGESTARLALDDGSLELRGARRE